MKIRVYYYDYSTYNYKIPAQLVQNFGHTPHSMCSEDQNYGTVPYRPARAPVAPSCCIARAIEGAEALALSSELTRES